MATNKRLIKSNDEGGGVAASFNTVTYTGNGGTQSITGVGFQPDLVWIKDRTSGSENHWLFDVQRGGNIGLSSNLTGGDYTLTNTLSSFNDSGFTVGSDGKVNRNNDNYVAWNFKAGGAAVTNTDGTITSQVSANTEAGFSIVSYTGTGSPENIGHGLGVAPSIYIIKNRDTAIDWTVLTNIIDGSMDYLFLNQTAAAGNASESQPTSTTFNAHGNNYVGALNNRYIAYCFAEVAGFSKFGSYVGNGSTTNVVTGFEPAFLIVKEASAAGSWFMVDNKRGVDKRLLANVSDAEGVISGITFLENGFGISGGLNSSSTTYIYMAFANQF